MKLIKPGRTISFRELWNNVDLRKPFSWGIIGSNLAVILFAFIDNLSAADVMWIYWIQSVIIGIFNFFRILMLKNFSVIGMKINGKEISPNRAAKVSTAIFFLFHYGFFHIVYAVFLVTFPMIISEEKAATGGFYLFFTAAVFFVNYGVEFYKEQTTVTGETPNLGAVMFMPYFRIIPMHLTIILGGFIAASGSFFHTDTSLIVIILLMGIKTFVDLITHSVDIYTGLSAIQKS
ncbi:MAG: hypothetical protein HZC46_06620 [Ignavibacterium album]|uniref:DUF6498-containing protein n=1 Tax=Ignavibacterium album TaxID=591197 RepID=UPI0026F0A26E|nr:DUF6498-containing protein [Ignavibacterium album]MBI5661801.1 hypothetical protein [Ignavibacterium album]